MPQLVVGSWGGLQPADLVGSKLYEMVDLQKPEPIIGNKIF